MAKAQDDGLKKLKAEAQSLYENGMKLTDIAKKSANQMAQSAAGRAKADGDIAAIKINKAEVNVHKKIMIKKRTFRKGSLVHHQGIPMQRATTAAHQSGTKMQRSMGFFQNACLLTCRIS